MKMAHVNKGKTDCCPLFRALKKGDSEKVESLLKHGMHVNFVDSSLCTPLHWAAFLNNINAAEILIRYGADVNSLSSAKRTPLHEACSDGSLHLVKLLVKNGADITAKDYSNRQPIHLACINNKQDVVTFLIETGSPLTGRAVPQETTPLLEALTFGHARLAEQLIVAGSDVTVTDREGRDALYYALRVLKTKDLIRLLPLLEIAGSKITDRHEGLVKQYHPNNEAVLLWVKEDLLSPKTLKELVRLAIRKHLLTAQNGRSIQKYVRETPLPCLLRQYLSLQ